MATVQQPVIIIDTGVIRGTGKPTTNQHTYQQIRQAVESENQTLYLPATMYEELGGDPSQIPSGSEWVDPLLKQGWVDVAPKVLGDPNASFSSPATQRGKLRHAVEHAILQEKSGSSREWEDTALAGLADRVLSNAQATRVIIHTTDKPAQKAINRVLATKWQGCVRTYFHHPHEPKTRFRNPDYFRW
ncbi:MAG: hypothetical protein V5A39_05165 [Haloarculaceae archaeon]